MMSTINDVSRLAGVSKATVSRVLSGSRGVKEASRQAVLQAARSPVDRAAVEALPGNPARAIEKMKEYGYLIEVENRLLALPLIPPGAERIEKSRVRYRSLFRGQTLPAATVWEEGSFIQVGR